MNVKSMRLPTPDPLSPATLWLKRWSGDKGEVEYASIDSYSVNPTSGAWEAILRTKRGLEYVDSHGHPINVFAWHPIDWTENMETNAVSPPEPPAAPELPEPSEPAPVDAPAEEPAEDPDAVAAEVDAEPVEEAVEETAAEPEVEEPRIGGEISQAVMRRRTSRGK